jgi:hypothetical protein
MLLRSTLFIKDGSAEARRMMTAFQRGNYQHLSSSCQLKRLLSTFQTWTGALEQITPVLEIWLG